MEKKIEKGMVVLISTGVFGEVAHFGEVLTSVKYAGHEHPYANNELTPFPFLDFAPVVGREYEFENHSNIWHKGEYLGYGQNGFVYFIGKIGYTYSRRIRQIPQFDRCSDDMTFFVRDNGEVGGTALRALAKYAGDRVIKRTETRIKNS
jgi:hypothetical protein